MALTHFEFLANGHFSRVPHQLSLSVNVKYDEVKRGLSIDLLVFMLRLRKPRKISTKKPSKDCATSHRLKRIPLLPIDVDRMAQKIGEREGRRGEIGKCAIQMVNFWLNSFHISEGKQIASVDYFNIASTIEKRRDSYILPLHLLDAVLHN